MRYQSVYFSSLLQVQWKSNKFPLLSFCCWGSPPLFVYLFCFKISKLNSKPLCLLHYPLLAVNETSTYQFKNQSKIVVWSGRLFEKYPLFVLELASLLAMFWPAQQMSLRGCHHLSRFTLFPIFSPTSLQPLPTPIFSAYNSIYPDSPSFFSPTSLQSIVSAYTSATYSDLPSFLFSHQHLFNLFQTYSHPSSSLFLPTIIV